MKKMLFVALLLIVGISDSMAQSLLRVRLSDNSRFSIAVNGRYYKRQGTSITVGDLPPGRHHLKIYSIVYDRWGRAYERVTYQGRVNTEYRMITQFVYDPYTRKVSIREVSSEVGYANADGRQDEGPGVNYEHYKKGNDDDLITTPPVNDHDSKATGRPAASPVQAGTLTDNETEQLKKKTEAKKTDTEKLNQVKEGLRKETITTIQVSNIMDWFLFESTRLEFAKWAYAITTDKDFYGDLSSKFSYKSSKDELEQFVKSRK